MKRSFFMIVLFAIFLYGCQNVKIIDFSGSDNIMEGESGYIKWSVENADSIEIQPGFKKYNTLIDNIVVSPTQTTDYKLIAYGRGGPVVQNYQVVVTPKPIVIPSPPPPTPLPEQTFKNATQTKFLKGLIGIEEVDKDALELNVFGIDNKDYPKTITLFVTVKDKFGNFISKLAPPYGTKETGEKYFLKLAEIIEGNETQINDFSVEEVHVSKQAKNSFALVLDYSGSMTDDIKDLEKSVQKFLKQKSSSDEVSVVKFDHRVKLESPLTMDLDELKQNVDFTGLIGWGGWTALLAAGDMGIQSLNKAKYDRKEILFTDGWENASFAHFPDLAFLPSMLVRHAREQNVIIYSIGFGRADYTMLDLISVLTGGKLFIADNGNEIDEIYSSFPILFRNYYKIQYTPVKQDGMHYLNLVYNNNIGGTPTANAKYYIGDVQKLNLDKDIPSQIVTHFDFGKSRVNEYDLEMIKKVAEYLNQHPDAKLKIYGHTDSKGSKAANLILSKKRANAVRSYFIKNGIDKSRLEIQGFGEEKLIYNPDDAPWQSKENRRVEVKII